MPLMVTLSCSVEDCGAYEEATAGIEDGVNVIETEADGWLFVDGDEWCPDHRALAEGSR